MSRREKWQCKLNRKYRVCLLRVTHAVRALTILLVIFMLPVFCMNTEALGGTLTGSASENDTFWHGITAPSDLKISQKVKVTDGGVTGLSNVVYENAVNLQNISIAFSRNGVFKPSISVETVNSHPQSGSNQKWRDYQGNEAYFGSVQCNSKGTSTYYRVITDDSVGSNMGDQLLNYYNSSYTAPSGKKKSLQMMVTTEDNWGRIFNNLVEACAAYNGWKKYNGEGILLWQNAKTVKRIEMITVNPIDYYYSAYDTSGSYVGFFDLDVTLYTTHSYQFNYTVAPQYLAVPTIGTESGYSLNSGIPEDDVIILTNTNNQSQVIAKSQYYLSATKVANPADITWNDYRAPFQTGGMNYLYVRSYYTDGTKCYIESAYEEIKINYLPSTSAILSSAPINGSSVDVGDEIDLSYSGGTGAATLVYAVDTDSTPTLTRVSYADRQRLTLDALASGSNYLEHGGVVYVKNSGIWYRSSEPELKKYTGVETIVTEEQLRVKNTIVVYALVVDEGKELSDFQPFRFTYGAKNRTEAPVSTVTTSTAEPATVQMGEQIGLLCNTQNSKIFYTTNGSAPIILVTPDGPAAGANTKEYNATEGIVVNESIADYMQSFLIMAQAVTYKEIDGSYYRTHMDSTIARFVYKVGGLTPVKAVKSIPQTSADTPLEVHVGDRIQLYSETDGVNIYYTLDGSEPQFDQTTMVPGINTYKYSGAEGVIVKKATDSSLLTITAVAYKEGLASSDISRMIYAYPSAVSSPYANPSSGTVAQNTKVALQTATQGAVIYYEVAYGDKVPASPSAASRVFDTTVPIEITQKTTVKAYAVKDGMESAVSTFVYDVSDRLTVPVPSVETGAVVTSGTVITLNADSDAVIHYTLDGSDPKDSANKKVLVGNNVVLSGDRGSVIVLRAYAAKNGYSDSEVGNYSYSISTYSGGIYANRESGSTVKAGDVISLYTDMSDAAIYYTTDGSVPTKESREGNSVWIDAQPGTQMTIMAIAVMEGSQRTTSFATFTYKVMNKLSAPTASIPNQAVFTGEGVVKLNAETGSIYYTTDGTIPTTSSNLYKKSIVVNGPVTIKAIAVDENYQQSDVSTFVYLFADQVSPPTANYSSGELEMGTTVTFSTVTEGASIYYRTDGTEPNLDNKDGLELYTGPITINRATAFKVIAVKDHMKNSRVLSVGYTVREPVVVEQASSEAEQMVESNNGRLQSRRSFSDTESGPSYTDIILRNATYGVVISGEEGSIQENAVLKVENVQATETAERMVKAVLSDSYGVVAGYEVKLMVEDEEVQPTQQIEVGIPIPIQYQNSVIQLVRIQEDGYIKQCSTRRAGGVAYVITGETGNYSIVAPTEYQQKEGNFWWKLIGCGGACVLVMAGSTLMYFAKIKKEEGEELYV